MKKIILSFTLLASSNIFSAAIAAVADEKEATATNDERQQVLKKFVTLMWGNKEELAKAIEFGAAQMKTMFASLGMPQAIIAGQDATLKEITPEIINELQSAEFLKKVADIFDETFSTEELSQWIVFLVLPIGKKVSKLGVQNLAKINELCQAIVVKKLAKLRDKIIADAHNAANAVEPHE